MTITIVSLLDQVLNINLPTYTDYKFFSNLFESNDNGEILTVQIASKEFKSRLSVFDELSKTNKACLTIKSVFDGIPEDSRFLVVPNKIDDTIVLYHLRQEVDKLNGITDIHSNLDKTKYGSVVNSGGRVKKFLSLQYGKAQRKDRRSIEVVVAGCNL